MPNSFDLDPRSPSNRRLFGVGVGFIVVTAVVATLMVAKSTGALDNLTRVDIELVNIGDGLPDRSDVKFRGVLIGSVSDVTPSAHGRPNVVHVSLKPEYASGVPDTVTARVVPSNIFAVSAVQLVDNGPGAGRLRSGAVIHEDKTLPTVLFQNVLARLRQLLAAVARKPDDHSIGLMAALAKATHGRGQQLSSAGRDLNEVLAELNSVVSADDNGPSTMAALAAAANGLRTASPELFDALDTSIQPMQTFAEKRVQLADLLSAGLATSGTLGEAFDNQTDRLITISTELTPALAGLANHANELHGVATKMQNLAEKFHDEVWDPHTKMLKINVALGLTPTRTYVRADCPRYGALEGPSCQTAPEMPTAPDLMPSLGSMGYPPLPDVTENRPNLTPPRHSMPGDPQGPPAPPPPPQVLPPLPPGAAQLPLEPPGSAPLPADTRGSEPGIAPQAAVIGGNVGPVGSREEKSQLSEILGTPATATTELLLGPLVRGMTVTIAAEPGGER